MEKMLVTQALNELKTLGARIERAISSAKFIDVAKTCESKVDPSKTKEQFSKDALASMQSINNLITRREKIKASVVDSNAKTIVTICGEDYTVAEVIDMKSTINYKKILLDLMKLQLRNAKATMNMKNSTMEAKIEQLVAAAFGKESKSSIKEDDYASIANPYRLNNEYSLVDPIKIEEKIKALEECIEEFEANVDTVLQVSNCITYIEF